MNSKVLFIVLCLDVQLMPKIQKTSLNPNPDYLYPDPGLNLMSDTKIMKTKMKVIKISRILIISNFKNSFV